MFQNKFYQNAPIWVQFLCLVKPDVSVSQGSVFEKGTEPFGNSMLHVYVPFLIESELIQLVTYFWKFLTKALIHGQEFLSGIDVVGTNVVNIKEIPY